jgi:RNA polymerase sigma factor (sigma-70 family)
MGAAAGELAFERCFDRLFTRAFHVALKVLGDKGEAEDVAAEAMARALRSWRRVGSLDAPEAWVVRVTTNLAIDALRRRKRRQGGSAPATPTPLDDVADTRVDLHALLRSLPQRQREVVALRYLADMSEAETAAVLGIALGTVKRHANRGITRMREEALRRAS